MAKTPFSIELDSNDNTASTITLAVVSAALFVTIVLFAVFDQWCVAIVLSIVSAVLALALCIVSLLSARFVRSFPISAEPLVRLAILVTGTLLLMTPIALFAGAHPDVETSIEPHGNAVLAIFSAVYASIRTVALDMTTNDWIAGEELSSRLPDFLLGTHAFFLLVNAIACPLAGIFAAVDAFLNGVSGTRIRFWSWRKSHGTTAHEIYVFHELDEYGFTLARSIIRERRKELPLLIFANVGDLEASRDDTLMKDLLDKAKGKAFVLYTSLPAETIPQKLSWRALKTCRIRYFAISENSSTNLQTAVQLWDVVFAQLWNATWQVWHKDIRRQSWRRSLHRQIFPENHDDLSKLCGVMSNAIVEQSQTIEGETPHQEDYQTVEGGLRVTPTLFESILTMGERISIHCLHAHPDDGSILDSLVNRAKESIASCLESKYKQDGTKLPEGMEKLAGILCNLIEIRLMPQTNLAVCRLFDKHPLHEALDPINLADMARAGGRALRRQQLTVLILGCGTYGTEAIKTAFWLGRFAGTQLKIVVVEKEGVQAKMERLFRNCPGLMTERTYSENLYGPRNGKWSITQRHETPTVRFCQMDAFDIEMQALVNGQDVHTMRFTLEEEPLIEERIEPVLSDKDHLYCLVCLGDDETGLEVALSLQRNLAQRRLRAKRTDGTQSPIAGHEDTCVPIALRLRNDNALATSQLGEDGIQGELWKQKIPLYPFGSITDIFTYGSIADDKTESRAMHVHATYEMANHEHLTYRKARIDYFGISEFNKLQNRAVSLSIPYKLWMLGLDRDTADSSQLRRALGDTELDSDDARRRFGRGLSIPMPLENGDLYKPSEDGPALDTEEDGRFRDQWPLLSYVADLEHVRWCAFYRSLGWRDTLSLRSTGYEDLTEEGLESERVESTIGQLKKIRDRIALRSGTQHLDLRVHYYLCDNIDELGQRGKDCGKHPFSYDRMILWHCVDILNCQVSE